MPILALDLGGTKLSTAVFSPAGEILSKETVPLAGRKGRDVADLIKSHIRKQKGLHAIDSIGVSVPGISRHKTGSVWAPNIEGWEDYPLMDEVKQVMSIPVTIESDRACSIYGERWKGNARNCRDVIFIAVGTGIGAGIIAGGNLIRGSNDIAGAIGWMALPKPFESKYIPCGCFEFYASGAGIPKFAREVLQADPAASILREVNCDDLTARDIFDAFEKNDTIASVIMKECISYWGMAAANLVSIFNPQKIIFGGGVFGPAVRYIDAIKNEAAKWAQPISITQVTFDKAALGPDAAVFGAAFLALKHRTVL